MRNIKRNKALAILMVAAGSCGLWASPAGAEGADRRVMLSQRSSDISDAQKRSRRNTVQAPTAPRPHRGFADPSIGPDGKPYRVPEYLRNQCYIDEGYGRFSACNFFN